MILLAIFVKQKNVKNNVKMGNVFKEIVNAMKVGEVKIVRNNIAKKTVIIMVYVRKEFAHVI